MIEGPAVVVAGQNGTFLLSTRPVWSSFIFVSSLQVKSHSVYNLRVNSEQWTVNSLQLTVQVSVKVVSQKSHSTCLLLVCILAQITISLNTQWSHIYKNTSQSSKKRERERDIHTHTLALTLTYTHSYTHLYT